nr:reverse transcriptase domain-containing protein [Tanacetum cinerariifolium]
MVRQSYNGSKRKSPYKQSEEWMDVPITFPPVSTDDVSDGPLIVEAAVEGCWIQRVFVDQGAAVQVMFEHCFDNLSPDIKARLAPTQTELVGFSGEQLIPIRKIELKVCFRERGLTRNTIMKFMVVRASSPYSIILGRTGLLELWAVSSTIHGMMNFPTPKGIATICARAKPIYECRWSERKVVEQEETIKETKEIRNQSMEEEEKGTYYYVKMPFGLKNTGATYQRLIDSDFQTQLGRNLEAYMDDMVIKSKTERDMIIDIAETFDNMRKINMKLNPMKCSFGIGEGKFLGYMVRGAIPLVLRNTENITKENKEDYKWTEEAEHAFQELKKLILELSTLTTPELKETLFVYLATSHDAVSGVLVADRKGKQMPIRYVSQTLHEAERNYAPLEKLALCLLHLTLARTKNSTKDKGVDVGCSGGFKIGGMQMNCEFIASNEGMEKHLAKAKVPAALFKKFSIRNIPRNQNQKADVLSKLALVAFNHLTNEILVKVLNSKSVDVQKVNTIVEEEEYYWMTPIIKCLEEGVWPTDKNEARTFRMKIGQYVVEDEVLFKKSYLSPMLRCVGSLQVNYIIKEVHERACGLHAKARSVAAKIMRQGYYWPTMHRDTKEVVDKCDIFQIHASVTKLPKTRLTSVMSPWPFYQWGLDILGPLLEGPGKLKFIIVAIDYFTKWIEAKPLAKTTYNGTQLVNDPFKSWCEKWKIKHMNTAVAHPQANDLMEKANKSLMHGLKARLGRERVGWVNELPNILWAHRTMLKTSNGETPFSLTYGSEAFIPAEIGMSTYRTIHFNELQNVKEMRLNLDLSQERRETTTIREAKYKKKVEQCYNKRVRPMSFKVGDFVYRKNAASRVEN